MWCDKKSDLARVFEDEMGLCTYRKVETRTLVCLC
jgi:hypothetical protein